MMTDIGNLRKDLSLVKESSCIHFDVIKVLHLYTVRGYGYACMRYTSCMYLVFEIQFGNI